MVRDAEVGLSAEEYLDRLYDQAAVMLKEGWADYWRMTRPRRDRAWAALARKSEREKR